MKGYELSFFDYASDDNTMSGNGLIDNADIKGTGDDMGESVWCELPDEVIEKPLEAPTNSVIIVEDWSFEATKGQPLIPLVTLPEYTWVNGKVREYSSKLEDIINVECCKPKKHIFIWFFPYQAKSITTHWFFVIFVLN